MERGVKRQKVPTSLFERLVATNNLPADVMVCLVLSRLPMRDVCAFYQTSRFFNTWCKTQRVKQRMLEPAHVYTQDCIDYSYEKDNILPTKDQIVDMCSNLETCAILTASGQMYMFGNGLYGRFGDGNESKHLVRPPNCIRVPFGKEQVTNMACGSRHTAVCTNWGRVYTFGNGEYGKLGDGSTSYHYLTKPYRVTGALEHEHAVQVCCLSTTTTAVLTQTGRIYGFGLGVNGVLGDGNPRQHFVPLPQRIRGPLETQHVTHISYGDLCVSIVTRQGHLYVLGVSAYGSLGAGDFETEECTYALPKRVHWFWPDEHVITATCIGTRVVALTKTGRVYITGCLLNKGLPVRVCGTLEHQHVLSVHLENHKVYATTLHGQLFCIEECENGEFVIQLVDQGLGDKPVVQLCAFNHTKFALVGRGTIPLPT